MRKGQFFIISAVLVAFSLVFITNILVSSETINFSTLLESHGPDIVENVAEREGNLWWNRSWYYRKAVIVEERNGDFVEDEATNVVVDVLRSRAEDSCDDIRVIDGGAEVPWVNSTACNIDTYRSESGAVGRWKMDRGEGTELNDSTGNGNDGTFSGSPEWTGGRFGRGLLLDGGDSVSISTSSPAYDAEDVTVSAWAYPDPGGTVVSEGNRFVLSIDGSGASWTVFPSGGGGGNQISGGSVDAGEWYHVVGTYDTGTGEQNLYLDGREVASASPGIALGSGNDDQTIGVDISASSDYFEGRLDDVRIYNHSMDRNRVMGEAQNGIGLNVSVNITPLETKKLLVYYGNPGAGNPGYVGSDLEYTPEEVVFVKAGLSRSLDEVTENLAAHVNDLNDAMGPQITYTRAYRPLLKFSNQTYCDRIEFRSPLMALEREMC